MGDEDENPEIDFSEEDEESTEPDYEIPREPLVQKSGIIHHEHKNIDERPDSITIGTPSKGGEVKVYFNADDDQRTTEDRIVRAFAARKFAQNHAKLQEEQN